MVPERVEKTGNREQEKSRRLLAASVLWLGAEGHRYVRYAIFQVSVRRYTKTKIFIKMSEVSLGGNPDQGVRVASLDAAQASAHNLPAKAFSSESRVGHQSSKPQ